MKVRLVPVVLLLAACGVWGDVLGSGGETTVQPGVIAFYDDPIVIHVPESAAVGESVSISVRTYGGGCTSKGETRVTRSGLSAEVAPFDSVYVPGPNEACTDILLAFDHEAVVVFQTPGLVGVIIRGRALPDDKPFSRYYSIMVR